MKRLSLGIVSLSFATLGALGFGGLGLGTLGCATPAATPCTSTPFISPTTATLDHTVANNAQQFTTGLSYSGSNCAIPATNAVTAIVPGYVWNLSDTIDATITTALGPTATASCKSAALNPITVYTTLATYPPGSSPTGPPTYVSTGLPSATLTCK